MTSQGQFVYVVDDDEAVRDSTHLWLLSHGMACKAFASPRKFLSSYDPGRAVCLVLDLHMPEMSGLELLELMHARDILCPVIVLSGRRDAVHDLALRRAGAMAILSKPPLDAELLGLIKKAMAGGTIKMPRGPN